jgi:hypothetical protein
MTPMTREQLQWVEEQVRHAADKAAKRTQRRALVGFLTLLFGLLAAIWIGGNQADSARKAIVDTGRIVSVSGCNRDYEDRVAVRKVLIASKDFTKNAFERLNLTPEELQLRLDFYDDQLADLPLPDCRQARNVVSDDPTKVPAFPEPLYPGHDE